LSRDVRLYLEDVVTCCEKIVRFTQGMTREEIIADGCPSRRAPGGASGRGALRHRLR
jgi:hypothetical protein